MDRSRVAASAVLTLLVIACSPPSVPPSGGASGVPPSPAPTVADRPTPQPTVVTFGDGRLTIGDDIPAGTYRVVRQPDPGGSTFCYWERVSGFGGSEAETIANSAGVGPRVVTIEPTDAGFVSEDCGTWTADLAPLAGPVVDGVWIVGVDVQPGRYVADGGDLCLWQRLSGFGGTADDVLQTSMVKEVVIEAGDAGFNSSHCGAWEPAGG